MYQQIFTNQMNPQYQYYQQCVPPYYYYPQQHQYYPLVPQPIMPSRSVQLIKKNIHQIKYEENEFKCGDHKVLSSPEFEKTSELVQTTQMSSTIFDKGNTLKPNLLVDSTNIQKNFSKAIVQYALRQKKVVYQILGEEKGNEFLQFISELVNQLRNLFHLIKHTQDEDFLRAIRILGNNFLRKESTCYIYNSKIRQKTSHIKHKAIVKKVLMKL